jgi:hypothetical protein
MYKIIRIDPFCPCVALNKIRRRGGVGLLIVLFDEFFKAPYQNHFAIDTL